MTFYSQNAQKLSDQYNALPFETVHEAWRHLLPSHSALILDVGAGSGRDALWLAQHGHDVIAVEPCAEFRNIGANLTPPNVRWLDDSLPGLAEVHRLDLRLDVILLSAVWMHLAPGDRERAFRKLSSLLRPGGILVLIARETPFDDGRAFYPTHPEDLRFLARKHLLQTELETPTTDRLSRANVTWRTYVFRMPDDGTGALPLLRHIILNDAKSSTYKLALLRCLLRVADTYPGSATTHPDGSVAIPLGLVALVWIRFFKRLLLDGPTPLPQQPANNTGYGFAKASFQALKNISVYDLRPGQTFSSEIAIPLLGAIRDAADTITKMPAYYIKSPNSQNQIFTTTRAKAPSRLNGPLTLQTLSAFGEIHIPASIWDALRTHACWIEPALIAEWARMIAGYQGHPNHWCHPNIIEPLQWLDPEHRTTEARKFADQLRASGQKLYCVWTGKILARDLDIDHCLPFSIWPNNDLWNLVPSCHATNLKKNDRLVCADTLQKAAERIKDWWNRAYLAQGLESRFLHEATTALPVVRNQTTLPLIQRVFLGLEIQRTTLHRNQQLREWSFLQPPK